jgi:hypothetical protein
MMPERPTNVTLRSLTLPGLLVLAGLAVYFAPFWLLGMHSVPFGFLPPAVTGIDASRLRVQPEEGFPGGDSSAVLVHYPNAWLVGEYLRSFELPTWNPFVACGAPGLENGQMFPFNPFLWPFYGVPNPWTYTLALLLGCAFCAAGAYLLLGRFTAVPWQRAAGALVWTFNPWSTRLLIYTDVWAAWWFPWVLWAWGESREGRRPWWFPAPFLALMVYSGHAEASFLLAAASAAWVVADWLGNGDRGRLPASRFLLRVLGAASLAGLLSALQWLPVVLRLREAAPYKLDDPWAVTMPFYQWSSLLRPRSEVYLSPVLFALLCAGVAVLYRRGVLRLPLLFLAAVAVWGFAAVPLTVVVKVLTLGGLLPGVYARCLIWCGVVPLALAGLTRWEDAESRVRWRTAPLVILAFSGLSLAGWLVWRGSASSAPRDLLFFEVGTLALLILGLLAPTAKMRGAALALGLACACLEPLAAQGFRWAYFNRADPLAGGPPAVAALRRTDPGGMSRFSGRWLGPATCALSPDLATLWGARDVRVTDVLNSRRYVRLHGILLGRETRHLGTWLAFPGTEPDALGLLGVTAFAEPRSLADAVPAWVPVSGMPRAFLVHKVVPAAGEREAADLMAALAPSYRQGRLRDEAVVEGMGDTSSLGAPDLEDGVASLDDGLDRVVLRTRSKSAGLLVLLDACAQGWRAEVDGRPVAIHPANLAFRAVEVPAGIHEVRFTYRPSSVRWGMGLTGIGLVLLLGAVARDRRGGRP